MTSSGQIGHLQALLVEPSAMQAKIIRKVCDEIGLTQVQSVGSAADARMHLIYPVLERSAPTLDVTVSADPRAWCCAGMAVHVVAVGALAQRYMADRWAPLMGAIAPATESLHVAPARLAASPSRSPRPCRLRFVAPAGETVTP